MRSCKRLPVAFPSVKIYKTPPHCFWPKHHLSKHLTVANYCKTLLKAWIASVIVRCYVLVLLGGSQAPKWAEIDQEIAFLVMKHKPLWKHLPIDFGMITICQNTFLLNVPLFCNGKKFWRIENAGNAGIRPLKTTSHCKKLTKKPQNRIKPCLKHAKWSL